MTKGLNSNLAGPRQISLALVGAAVSALLLPTSFHGATRNSSELDSKPALTINASQNARPRELSFADRVAYQYAIEEAYWRHRIWPKENGGPKPALDATITATQVRQKVENYLRNSELLANYWQQPITPNQLQAEMERMAHQTKQPDLLAELFAALNNDPALIAECLIRPVLTERLVHENYAHDERHHGALKRRAESDLRAYPSVSEMKRTSGSYSEVRWIKSDTADSASGTDSGAVRMTTIQWENNIRNLAKQFESQEIAGPLPWLPEEYPPNEPQAPIGGDGNPNAVGLDALACIKIGVLSPLAETESQYHAAAILKKDEGQVTVATITWLKKPFESWMSTALPKVSYSATELNAAYTLPQITPLSANCTPDSWAVSGYAPEMRYLHTAVWTGSEMIIWGGYNGHSLNTGGRYNPSTDTWLGVSSGAPAVRFGHTAVWTGSEMIVWGGTDDSSNELNTGGRYSPTTNSWIATNTSGAPSARAGHTAIWNGNKMILWGGSAGFYFNSGASYDPNADSWVATNIGSAPTGRSGHTAIWTGNEMIVWGGFNFVGYLNSGARYNPKLDNWVATNAGSAPPVRRSHTAVWTGSEMIAWGGYDGTNYLNSGGRYNPNTDGWVPTSTTGAPSGRNYHTAVWSESEMIAWGGYDGTHYLNSGGRYNPVTDSWLVINPSGAPTGRLEHTAIWVGSEMIVWGGTASASPQYTGGKYNPNTDSWVPTSIGAPIPARGARSSLDRS